MKSTVLKQTIKLNDSLIQPILYKLEHLSQELGSNIWCLRDDLTAPVFGGNKTRKLDYLVADAISVRATCLIAYGGQQSNFCALAAAYGSKYKLKTTLVFPGTKPPILTGNLKLCELFGANMQFIETEDINNLHKFAEIISVNLNAMGERPYFMPLGGSNSIGIRAYVDLVFDIKQIALQQKVWFNKTYVSAGSCGTVAGLCIGNSLNDLVLGEIIGISVLSDTENVLSNMKILTDNFLARNEISIRGFDFNATDSFKGSHYGAKTPEAEEAQAIFAQTEGILLDLVYTAKAGAAIIHACRKNNFSASENILFVHTGGKGSFYE